MTILADASAVFRTKLKISFSFDADMLYIGEYKNKTYGFMMFYGEVTMLDAAFREGKYIINKVMSGGSRHG